MAIQVVRNATGVYGSVQISVMKLHGPTLLEFRGGAWVGVKCAAKSVTSHLNGPYVSYLRAS